MNCVETRNKPKKKTNRTTQTNKIKTRNTDGHHLLQRDQLQIEINIIEMLQHATEYAQLFVRWKRPTKNRARHFLGNFFR